MTTSDPMTSFDRRVAARVAALQEEREKRERMEQWTEDRPERNTDVSKDTNPKTAFADRKAPLSAVPIPVLLELGAAMLEGALKYGRHNWRVEGVRYSTYFDATIRHLFAWWEGEDVDPDSGINHLTKAMASLAVMRDAIQQGKATDDRPPASPVNWQLTAAAQSNAIRDRNPDPKPPHTAHAAE